jgi:hypothetical protein
VLSEEIFDTDELGKSFEAREPCSVQAANPRKNAVIWFNQQWPSTGEQAD